MILNIDKWWLMASDIKVDARVSHNNAFLVFTKRKKASLSYNQASPCHRSRISTSFFGIEKYWIFNLLFPSKILTDSFSVFFLKYMEALLEK